MPANHPHSGIAAWRFNMEGQIHCYEDAAQFLQGDEDISAMLVSERRLASSMTVRREYDGGYIAIVLYDTEIVRFYPGDTFTVDNGGFATQTTTTRISAVLPGFVAFHRDRKLGLNGRGREIYPVSHDVRIDLETFEVRADLA
jgi:hypothetical protein